MPRSFLVDSLILREANDKGNENNPPLFPYAVHAPHHPHGLPSSCHSRKAGLLCFCPLCMAASQLHPSPPTLPLLKAAFPPFGSQYCHSALSRQHTSPNGVNLSHAPGIYQAAYSVPDPRQFHCISIGEFLRCFALFIANYFLFVANTRARLLTISLCFLFFFSRRKQQQQTSEQQTHAHSLHQHATFGAGARVHLEHVPLQTATHRDRHVPELVGETGEDLVSESAGEAQEGGQKQRPKDWLTQLQVHVSVSRQMLGGRGGRHAHLSILVREGGRGPVRLALNAPHCLPPYTNILVLVNFSTAKKRLILQCSVICK